MNVHPSAGVNPAGATTAEPFATEAVYELKIDTNGDAVADVAYRIQFSGPEEGQSATVRRVEGQDAAGTGNGGQIVLEGALVSTGLEARITEVGDYRFFAGWRSEPFFFDTQGALNNLQFTGVDFFAGADICSIVLELPNSDSDKDRSGCGRARWIVAAVNGFRPTADTALAIHFLDRFGQGGISRRGAGEDAASSRHSHTP
jgi:hypothetical protein